MKAVVFLGAPGAGKGTVAVRVANLISAHHISTGAMLREAVKNKTPAGVSAEEYMNKGSLVPDEVLFRMVDDLLTTAKKDDLLLFDGFPRNTSQAIEFDKLLSKHNAGMNSVIYLDVSESVIVARLGGRRVCKICGQIFHVDTLKPKKEGICDTCGGALIVRDDDEPATIRKRLAVYDELTAPLVAMYKSSGKLRRVDGAQDADKIAEIVASILRE